MYHVQLKRRHVSNFSISISPTDPVLPGENPYIKIGKIQRSFSSLLANFAITFSMEALVSELNTALQTLAHSHARLNRELETTKRELEKVKKESEGNGQGKEFVMNDWNGKLNEQTNGQFNSNDVKGGSAELIGVSGKGSMHDQFIHNKKMDSLLHEMEVLKKDREQGNVKKTLENERGITICIWGVAF